MKCCFVRQCFVQYGDGRAGYCDVLLRFSVVRRGLVEHWFGEVWSSKALVL